MLNALKAFRDVVKPVLPSSGHKALRSAFYGAVLPVMRGWASVRERLGADYSSAPPPAILAQYNFGSPDAYRRVGGKQARSVLHGLEEAGIALPEDPRILDFGCGAGGALLAMHERFPKAAVYGCDLKGDVIAWVNKYHPELAVRITRPAPPLPADFTGFDLVYAFSVWTHMPAAACQGWLDHLHERLKPGGAVVITVISPDSELVRRHGFDPATLPRQVRAAGGCLYDAGKDMSYIDRQWFEEQPLFRLHYYGEPKEVIQQLVVLTARGGAKQ